MTPTQEAVLECVGQGMTRHAACRRVGISSSSPYYWARDPEFKAAWEKAIARPRYHRIRVDNDWVTEIVGDLEYQGLIGQDVDREELRTCLTRFFTDRGILQPCALRKAYNRSNTSRAEQERIVDAYIKLKTEGATVNKLARFLLEHNLNRCTIGRWSRKYRGKGALHVGPWLKGNTANRIVAMLRQASAPMTSRMVSESLSLHHNTAQTHLQRLVKAGRVVQNIRARCGYYEVAA